MNLTRLSMAARSLVPLMAIVAWSVVVQPGTVRAQAIYKIDNSDNLNLTSSWSTTSGSQTPNPGSLATGNVWYLNDVTMLGSKTVSLGGDLRIVGIGLDNTTAVSTAYNVVINSGDTLTLDGGTISGTGVDGTGYSNAGIVLNRSVGGSLTINANIAVAANQQWVTSRALTVGGNIALGSTTLSFNTAGSSVQTLSGVISGTGNLNKSAGSGTLALANAANTFTGTVTLVGGNTTITTLANGGTNSSLGAGTSSIVMNSAVLTYLGTGTGTTNRAIDMRAAAVLNNNSASGAISFTAANVLQGSTASARTLTLGGTNTGDNTFGSILGDSGTGASISRLQKSGTGRWIVTGANTYTGATVINQGTLRVSGTGVLGGATGSTGDESNIWFTSSNANASLEFETVANLGPADQIRFRNTGGTAGQGGALVYIGTTNQTLGKTLQCDSSVGIRLESNSVGGSLTVNGAFSQSNRGLYLGGTGTGDNTLAIAFAGSGGLTKRGAGTWLLTAANTNTGGVTVEAGTLQVGAGSTTGSIAGNASVSGGATLAFNRSDAVTYAGIVGGGGNLRKAGGGTLTLSAASGYTGTTTVAAGTLALGSAAALASTVIDVQAGARLDVSALASGLSLGSGQRLGGRGTLIGDVSFGSGSLLGFDPTGPLVVGSGTLSFAAGFGIANLAGVDWDSLALNTPYTVVDTSQSFAASDISNFGFANRAAVGSLGREAYFQSGSLQLVVVPEPGTMALVAAGLALAGWAARRRR